MTLISTIYKYRQWTNPLHVDILKSRKIYLPSPRELNDPFDCRIPLTPEILDDDTKIKKYVDNYVVNIWTDLQAKGIDIPKFMESMENELKYNKEVYVGEYNRIYEQKGNLHFGIFCGSTIWDSIQMWTYYSENHSGFCIGFDPQKLCQYIPNFRSMKVIYRTNFPKIDPFISYDSENPSQEFIDNCFKRSHVKAIGWKYEKEYRIFSNIFPRVFTKQDRLIKIDNHCFKNLFVGINYPDKDLPIIKEFSKELQIPLYKIIQLKNRFKFGKIRIK